MLVSEEIQGGNGNSGKSRNHRSYEVMEEMMFLSRQEVTVGQQRQMHGGGTV